MREASRRDNDGRQRNDEALARLYEEEKQEAARQVSEIVRKLLTTTAQVGNFSLSNPDVIEAFCEGLQLEIDWLRSNS